MAFDPCREWLGIDAVDLADPCRVLGLAPDARDAEAIGRAADARLEALRRVAPGPFAKAHAALVARVEESRDTLLAEAFSAAPSRRAAAPLTAEPWAVTTETARWPAPPAPLEFESETEPTSDEILAAPSAGRPARRARRGSSGAGGPLLASLALLAAAAAMLVMLMLQKDSTARKKIALSSGRPPTANAAASATPRPQPPAAQPPSTEPPPSAGEPAPAADPPADEAAPSPPPGMTEHQSRAEQEAAAQAAEEARRRQETEAAEAEQEQRRMLESLEASLGDAYAALQRGEFDAADRTIAAAEQRIGDDVEAATRLERWRLLATYVREFGGYREQAFAAANTGREYTVEGQVFAVVEITPTLFIYRLAGRTERTPRERIDPRIEMAVVEAWFAADGRPANHLFLGAHWLCLDPPNLPRAKAEWRIAGDGGEQVEPLVALLDDPVIRRAARRRTP